MLPGLWIIFVLCFVNPMSQCLWIIFILCFVNPMLPVTLDYLRPVFCEDVASVSGLSSACVLWTQCCTVTLIIFVLCNIVFNPMLPVSLDYLRPVFCEPNVASVSGLSFGVHKTQDEDNPVSLATLVFCEPNEDNASVSGTLGSQNLCSSEPNVASEDYWRPWVLWTQCCQWLAGLSSSCVLWTQCCQCLWIIFVLCFVIIQCHWIIILCSQPNVARDFALCLWIQWVFCEPNVASDSGLSSSCVLWTQCCQWLWIIFVLCFVNKCCTGRR